MKEERAGRITLLLPDSSPRTSLTHQAVRMSPRKSFLNFPKDTNDRIKVLLTQQNTFAAICWSNWPRMILTSLPCGQRDKYVKVSVRQHTPEGSRPRAENSRAAQAPRQEPCLGRAGRATPHPQPSPARILLPSLGPAFPWPLLSALPGLMGKSWDTAQAGG